MDLGIRTQALDHRPVKMSKYVTLTTTTEKKSILHPRLNHAFNVFGERTGGFYRNVSVQTFVLFKCWKCCGHIVLLKTNMIFATGQRGLKESELLEHIAGGANGNKVH